MRVKVDEDLPSPIVRLLRTKGYEAECVVDEGMGGWKDPAVWQAAQAEQRFLITADKGFGDIRRYPPGTHSGVLLLRPDEDGVRPVVELLDHLLRVYNLSVLSATVTVVTPRGIRIRRA